MKRQVSAALGSVTTSAVFPMDRQTAPVSIGIGVVVSATATFSVQYTYDDVQDSTITPTWFTLTALSAKTATTDGNITWPVAAIRLNVTAWTSGTVQMTILQADRV